MGSTYKFDEFGNAKQVGDVNADIAKLQSQISASLVCSKCRRSLPQGTVFCQACGTRVDYGWNCPGCKSFVAPGSAVCGKCGYKKPTMKWMITFEAICTIVTFVFALIANGPAWFFFFIALCCLIIVCCINKIPIKSWENKHCCGPSKKQ